MDTLSVINAVVGIMLISFGCFVKRGDILIIAGCVNLAVAFL